MKKRNPNDAVVGNVKRLRAEVHTLASTIKKLAKRLKTVEDEAEWAIEEIGNLRLAGRERGER